MVRQEQKVARCAFGAMSKSTINTMGQMWLST